MSQTTGTLKRGLTRRHIRFIAFGSAIGTGLFYGSAGAIEAAGPSVLLAYLISGAVIFIVMRALGEMAVAHPSAGSFGAYAGRFLGPGAGFLTGWLYVVQMLVVVLADLTAFGIYLGFWFPEVPRWIWVVTVILAIAVINLVTVKVFGETEFWFSLIKVAAIIAMIVGGILLLVFGFSRHGDVSAAPLGTGGGFFANGFSGFAASFAVVLFGFGGIEIIGLTAAEAQEPKRTIPMAINSVPVRILLFYVLSLAVIMLLYPWQSIGTGGSPFVLIFRDLGMGIAASVLNIVVITAAFSAINADIFAAGRMAFGLAEQGHAPKIFARTTSKGVPLFTVLAMITAMAVGAILNVLIPDELFLIIASLVTFVTVWVWIAILLSHWSMRRRMRREGEERGEFPQPGWPISSVLALAFFAFALVVLAVSPDSQMTFLMGVAVFALLGAVYLFVVRPRARRAAEPAVEQLQESS
ncbi:amino acid permease [Streptomyces antimycoticus]|uniref:amino acid permease n=1 Tax=Streptomyces antimycoticus TaxID=68175 RepID=UPI000A3D1319|nr:amino acid permease [Streptomyces antimycoticus]